MELRFAVSSSRVDTWKPMELRSLTLIVGFLWAFKQVWIILSSPRHFSSVATILVLVFGCIWTVLNGA